MKQNLANWDRIVRAIVAILFFVLILTSAVSGWVATLLGVLGVVFLLTAVVGTCPLYMLLKFSTRKA